MYCYILVIREKKNIFYTKYTSLELQLDANRFLTTHPTRHYINNKYSYIDEK